MKQMLIDTSSNNRMFADDIANGINFSSQILLGGMGITNSTSTGIFKVFGWAPTTENNIDMPKGCALIYYNGTGVEDIVRPGEIAVCFNNQGIITVNADYGITLYIGYNEEKRVNEAGTEYVAYRDFFFSNIEFSGYKLKWEIGGDSVYGLLHQHTWNSPNKKSIGIAELNTPFIARSIIAAYSVGALQLENGAVTTLKLANGAVTYDKLDPSIVNGLTSDIIISSVDDFKTKLPNILANGNSRVRIKKGTYALDTTINLGSDINPNVVDIWCDAGVIIDGRFTGSTTSILTVTNVQGKGVVNWHGGTIRGSYNGTSAIADISVMRGFHSISDVFVETIKNASLRMVNLNTIMECNNINNANFMFTDVNNSGFNAVFYKCINLNNIKGDTSIVMTKANTQMCVFNTCNDISNVAITCGANTSQLINFNFCVNITCVSIGFVGNYPPTENIQVQSFLWCKNISNVQITSPNYGYNNSSYINNVHIFSNSQNISNVYMLFSGTTTDEFQSIAPFIYCDEVSQCKIVTNAPMSRCMLMCKGVINNSCSVGSNITKTHVYFNSYISGDTTIKCDDNVYNFFNNILNY